MDKGKLIDDDYELTAEDMLFGDSDPDSFCFDRDAYIRWSENSPYRTQFKPRPEDRTQTALINLQNPDPRLRQKAIRFLGRLRDPHHSFRLLPFLQAPEPGVRQAAAKALYLISDQRTLLAMAEALSHPDPGVREWVLKTCKNMLALPLLAPLFQALERETEPGLRDGIVALLRRGFLPSRTEPFCLRLLQSPEPFLRAAAISILNSYEEPCTHLQPLIRSASEDPDEGVRLAARLFQNQIQDPAFQAWVREGLTDPDPRVRKLALRFSPSFDYPGAIDALASLLQHPQASLDSQDHFWFTIYLGIASPENRARIISLMPSLPPERQIFILPAFTLNQEPALKPVFLNLLQSQDPFILTEAIEYLWFSQAPLDDDVSAALKGILKDPAHSGWLSAARSLVYNETGLEAAIPALAASWRQQWKGALSTLRFTQHDPRAEAIFLEALADPRPAVRAWAAAQLPDTHHIPLIQRLIDLLDDGAPQVRRAAAYRLGRLGIGSVAPKLAALLSDPHARVQQAAVSALGDLGQEQALPALLEKLSDWDPDTRETVAHALQSFDSPEVVPALIRLLRKDPAYPVRITAADSLRALKAQAAMEPLAEAMEKDIAPVYEAAARALKNIGEAQAAGN